MGQYERDIVIFVEPNNTEKQRFSEKDMIGMTYIRNQMWSVFHSVFYGSIKKREKIL